MNNEGQIFIINKRNKWKNQKYILKKLYYDEGDNFGNKLLTVNALIDRQDEMNIEEIILPTKLAVYKNKIIGFYMPFIDNINFNYIFLQFNLI